MEINKDYLKEKAKEYILNQNKLLILDLDLYLKSKSSFFLNINKLSNENIKYIIDKKQEYTNSKIKDKHFLYFLAKKNSYDIFNYGINKSVLNGLKEVPTIEEKYNYNTIRLDLFDYCLINDYDQSYSTMLLNISNPESLDYKKHIIYAIENNSLKSLNFIKTFTKEEDFQNIIYNYFYDNFYKEKTRFHYVNEVFSKYNYDINKFQEIGINFNYKFEENMPNYLEIFTQGMNEIFLYQFHKNQEKLTKKIITMYDFFVNNGFSLEKNSVNNLQYKPMREIFEFQFSVFEKKEKFFTKPVNVENHFLNINKKSLDNFLEKKEDKNKTKIKI